MMIKTQKNIFAIMTSTNVNLFIYYFKRIPFIGRALPDSIYGNISLKRKLTVLASILKIISKFLGKAIYLLLMILLPILMLGKAGAAAFQNNCYVYLFAVLSLICGPFQISSILKTDKTKFICIRLMRMDAKSYLLSRVLFRNLSDSLYFLPFLILSSVLMGGSFLQGLCLAVLFCCFRFMGEMLYLLIYVQFKVNLGAKTLFILTFDLICLFAAYAPVFLHKVPSLFNVLGNRLFVLIMVVLGMSSALFLMKFDRYYQIASETLKAADFTLDMNQKIRKAKFSDVAMREKEFSESELKSIKFNDKKGFAYLNAIFFERHRRLLVKPIFIRLAIIGFLFVTTIVISFFVPTFIKPLSQPGEILPAFVFIMYFASIGERVCKAMFYNCDISLLRYSFYRDKKAVLSNFKIRLIRVAGLNLIVACAISAAVIALLLIFKLPWSVVDVISFVASIILLALFFSVHHLFLYYVFQPYTEDLVMKNPFFNAIHAVVYMLCFLCIRIKSPPSNFTLIILASTIIYIVAALISVYKYAPKTFRIK